MTNLTSTSGKVHARLRPGSARYLCRSGERNGGSPAWNGETSAPVDCRACLGRMDTTTTPTTSEITTGEGTTGELGAPPAETHPHPEYGTLIAGEDDVAHVWATARHAILHDHSGGTPRHERVDPDAAWASHDRGHAQLYEYPDCTYRAVESAVRWWTLSERPVTADYPSDLSTAPATADSGVPEPFTILDDPHPAARPAPLLEDEAFAILTRSDDPLRPEHPDTTSGWPVLVDSHESMQSMRQHVNSARCAVMRHHRPGGGAAVTHEPVLAEQLWTLIDAQRTQAQIWQHQDDDADSGGVRISYTMLLPETAIGTDGGQVWFTTHPHPEPAVRANRRTAPLTDMLTAARDLLVRYNTLPQIAEVRVTSGSGARIHLQPGNSYDAAAFGGFTQWAAEFDAEVVIDTRYAIATAHVHAPGADGEPVAFDVTHYVANDRAERIVGLFAEMAAHPDVQVDGDVRVEDITDPGRGDTVRQLTVSGKLFAQTWRQAREDGTDNLGWPLTMGGRKK